MALRNAIAQGVADIIGVETVGALRALPGGPDEVVNLLGYFSRFDSDQGLFQWDTTPGVDNGVTRFNAGGLGSNTPGWNRIYSGAINVRWAGARGDGITDDAAAIQRAIDIAPSNLMGVAIYFPGSSPEQFPGIYLCGAALIPHNNTRFIGDTQMNGSGATIPATTIVDNRVNPATPFIRFLGDVIGVPQDRGCCFEHLKFSFPSGNKTEFSIIIDNTAGLTFRDCHFEWLGTVGGDPNPGALDPGGIKHNAFEMVVYDNCVFHYCSVQLEFAGSGQGGPLAIRNCIFYDSKAESIKCLSNGDHDYTLDGCMFDPLYRTVRPSTQVDLRCNGFAVRNCSFFGNNTAQPTGTYISVVGTGSVSDCNAVVYGTSSARPVWLTVTSGNVRVENNRVIAYCCINCVGAGSNLITRGNTFQSPQVPDASAATPIFQVKRAVIINYTYGGPCNVDLGPDFVISDIGPTLAVVDLTFATPIVLETAVADVLQDDDTVQIFGATGNTAANGYWVVNKIDGTHYELIGSVGNAAYTGGASARAYYHFTNSYYVGGDDGGPSYTFFTAGVIHWNRNNDQSGYSNINTAEGARGLLISGNVKVGGLVRLDVLDPIVVNKGTGQTMRHSDASGCLITNDNFISAVSYNLPSIEGGLRYEFEKRPDRVTAGNPAPKMIIVATPTTIPIVDVSNTTPIVVNTGTINHPFGTGDIITITGNAAANGTWTVTRIDTAHFSLDTSVAAGVVAGGTAARQSYIMLEGIKDGTLSIANSDTAQYNARISLEARFWYNTTTGLDEIRWFVKDVIGDWLDAGAAP